MVPESKKNPWQMLCEATGAVLRVIPITDAGEVDLAVGTRDHHNIVNVKPLDKGCRFALVYVETHGERQTM